MNCTREHGTDTEKTEYSIDRNSDFSVDSDFSDFSVSDIQDTAVRCAPTDEHDVNRALFQFARELRAMLPNADVVETGPHVDVWYKVALERVPELERSDVWWDFIDKWDAVKFPAGDDPMEMIVKAVAENEPPACSTRYGRKDRASCAYSPTSTDRSSELLISAEAKWDLVVIFPGGR